MHGASGQRARLHHAVDHLAEAPSRPFDSCFVENAGCSPHPGIKVSETQLIQLFKRGRRIHPTHKVGRTKTRKKWGGNQVLIEQDERLMVAVDFILRDEDFLLDGNGHPIATLAVLPAPVNGRPDRQLFVIVRKAPVEHFTGIVQRALNKIPSALGDRLAGLRLRGEVPVACITGYGDEEGSHAYMIIVPVAPLSDNSPTFIASTHGR